MMDTLKMDIDALLGERWFPKETSFEEDITEYWGEWGVCSACSFDASPREGS